jgi:hypothetical protein
MKVTKHGEIVLTCTPIQQPISIRRAHVLCWHREKGYRKLVQSKANLSLGLNFNPYYLLATAIPIIDKGCEY